MISAQLGREAIINVCVQWFSKMIWPRRVPRTALQGHWLPSRVCTWIKMNMYPILVCKERCRIFHLQRGCAISPRDNARKSVRLTIPTYPTRTTSIHNDKITKKQGVCGLVLLISLPHFDIRLFDTARTWTPLDVCGKNIRVWIKCALCEYTAVPSSNKSFPKTVCMII